MREQRRASGAGSGLTYVGNHLVAEIGALQPGQHPRVGLGQGVDEFEIVCAPDLFAAVSKALTDAGIEPDMSEITRLPKSTVDVSDPDTARKILKLMTRLDDHDDVQSVAANFNIPDTALAQLG